MAGKLTAVESGHQQEWTYWIENEDKETIAAVTRTGKPLAQILAAAPETLETLKGNGLRDIAEALNTITDHVPLWTEKELQENIQAVAIMVSELEDKHKDAIAKAEE